MGGGGGGGGGVNTSPPQQDWRSPGHQSPTLTSRCPICHRAPDLVPSPATPPYTEPHMPQDTRPGPQSQPATPPYTDLTLPHMPQGTRPCPQSQPRPLYLPHVAPYATGHQTWSPVPATPPILTSRCPICHRAPDLVPSPSQPRPLILTSCCPICHRAPDLVPSPSHAPYTDLTLPHMPQGT